MLQKRRNFVTNLCKNCNKSGTLYNCDQKCNNIVTKSVQICVFFVTKKLQKWNTKAVVPEMLQICNKSGTQYYAGKVRVINIVTKKAKFCYKSGTQSFVAKKRSAHYCKKVTTVDAGVEVCWDSLLPYCGIVLCSGLGLPCWCLCFGLYVTSDNRY